MRGLFERPLLDVCQHNFHAGGDEGLGHAAADATGGAGHHGDLIFEVFHGCFSGGQRAGWSGSAISRARGLIWKRTRSSSVTAGSLMGEARGGGGGGCGRLLALSAGGGGGGVGGEKTRFCLKFSSRFSCTPYH